jgi:hypothetical protein
MGHLLGASTVLYFFIVMASCYVTQTNIEQVWAPVILLPQPPE